MLIDDTTFSDLSIFNTEEEFSLFNKFDLTRTSGGREQLRHFYLHPLNTLDEIEETQAVIKLLIGKEAYWPVNISNGSIMVIYKFYETAIDAIPVGPSLVSAYIYKLLHGPDFGLVKYSAGHAYEFLKAFKTIINEFDKPEYPRTLTDRLKRAAQILDKPQFDIVFSSSSYNDLTMAQMLSFSSFIRYRFKLNFFELIDIYHVLDAWYGMAMSVKRFGLVFPEFQESKEPVLEIGNLYHVLLPHPVAYDVKLSKERNFIFLTGANMAGKSTFIKAVGAALFLAHLGMGVPAGYMRVSLFDGILTNINVRDNIVKGESFFYNEVRRIKNTILRVTDSKRWLVLIDELFKGTNIQDAMKCSTAVIKGLVKVRHSLFILSTHLYEISDELKGEKNIDFKYFQTEIDDDELKFSYQIKEGVSNDRLGYFILKNEKVVEMLDAIG